jgi:hypothetical protein
MRTSDVGARIALEIKIIASPSAFDGLGPEWEIVETDDPAVFLAFRPRGGEKVRVPETHFWLLGGDEKVPSDAHVLEAGDFRIAIQVGADTSDEASEDTPA